MEDNKQVAGEIHTDFGDVNKAIANLSLRVAELEKGAQMSVIGSGDGTDLRPIMLETLVGLKTLRTALITSASELDERLRELAASKEENSKLKYQIKHLKRSLEVEESKNAA